MKRETADGLMRKVRPCSVCEKKTTRVLLNYRKLDVPICSARCEHAYIESCNPKEETEILRYLDDKISKTRLHNRVCWAAAGAGLLIVAAGFFVANAQLFIFGILPLTAGALLTRHFEQRRSRLLRTRKGIVI